MWIERKDGETEAKAEMLANRIFIELCGAWIVTDFATEGYAAIKSANIPLKNFTNLVGLEIFFKEFRFDFDMGMLCANKC